jgi:hypothetical protein
MKQDHNDLPVPPAVNPIPWAKIDLKLKYALANRLRVAEQA